MLNKDSVKDNVLKVAHVLEGLASQIQMNLHQGKDIVDLANELAHSSSTFVFTVGALYALDKAPMTARPVTPTVVSNPNNTVVNKKSVFYNVRDSLGRFARV